MADADARKRPGPFWRIPPHVAHELAHRITTAGDTLAGVDIRIDSTVYGEPMTFDVRVTGDADASRVVPLNDTFKCPPICS